MSEALLYLASSFWLGAVHAATPGHGKTIAAAYIVGARGRPVDAWILGIFVTLSHTSGIVLVGVLASLGLPGMVPHRIEAWLAVHRSAGHSHRCVDAVDPANCSPLRAAREVAPRMHALRRRWRWSPSSRRPSA